MELIETTRRIALIEHCAMSRAGLCNLLRNLAGNNFKVECFTSFASCRDALNKYDYRAVIFAPGISRQERREFFNDLSFLAGAYPETLRIILVQGQGAYQMVAKLTPVTLHGIFSKSEPLDTLAMNLLDTLLGRIRVIDSSENYSMLRQSVRVLSPTERRILSFMAKGYSVSQIAQQLNRNIKTIRAHKFNAMSKLGVQRDTQLLDAADVLLSRSGIL